SYLKFAQQTARTVGNMIKRKINTEFKINTKESNVDFVTDIDVEAENMISSALSKKFPRHDILGEEGIYQNKNQSKDILDNIESTEYVWIVDPIDGTLNYMNKLPGYTVSIALAHRGEIVIGVIFDPVSNEMFYAEKNKGAYVNDQRIIV